MHDTEGQESGSGAVTAFRLERWMHAPLGMYADVRPRNMAEGNKYKCRELELLQVFALRSIPLHWQRESRNRALQKVLEAMYQTMVQ